MDCHVTVHAKRSGKRRLFWTEQQLNYRTSPLQLTCSYKHDDANNVYVWRRLWSWTGDRDLQDFSTDRDITIFTKVERETRTLVTFNVHNAQCY